MILDSYKKNLDHIRQLLLFSKKPFLFFDADLDGLSSFLCLKKVIPHLRGVFLKKSPESIEKALEYVDGDEDLILFFDLPILNESLLSSLPSCQFVWVDHHKNTQYDLREKYDIIYFNPLDFDEDDSRPSCFWAYCIAEQHKELLDQVSLGTVSDFYLLDVLLDFFDSESHFSQRIQQELGSSFQALYSYLVDRKKKNLVEVKDKDRYWIQQLWYETSLGQLKFFFEYLFKNKSEDSFQDLMQYVKKSHLDVLFDVHSNASDLCSDFNEFMLIQKKYVSKICKKNMGKRVFSFTHKGEESHNRQLSEEIMYRLDCEIFICFFKKQGADYYSFSIRSKQINIRDPLEKIISNYDGSGGGHVFSCGGSIHKKQYESFKQELLTVFEEKIKLHFQ
jgi:hypothetical protein